MKILHVLANSPPDVNGYAVRTHGLMKAYSELPNLEVVGLTSPWYPDRESLIETLDLDEITYHRCLHPARMKEIRGVGMKWTASREETKSLEAKGLQKNQLGRKYFSSHLNLCGQVGHGSKRELFSNILRKELLRLLNRRMSM